MLSPMELLEAVKVAKPGSFIEYYEGDMLTINVSGGKRAIQEASYTLYEWGFVLLVSKKVREEVNTYYAVRTKVLYVKNLIILNRFHKLERIAR